MAVSKLKCNLISEHFDTLYIDRNYKLCFTLERYRRLAVDFSHLGKPSSCFAGLV